ncbi:SH3 domain-containing protein [Paenibacillus filicis]|uniref:SH3 domain-containing protein n=1 Tax=Paenibacillus gyeongsangnamensis TaxID=3388067 RepID=A0ABT4QB52_9BACL|nr:SH3 domain-containing protein [Paenibacillus filicis]MCZ8514104.1 SH3 domain-containing protein [Paenibacillus filicis]
MKKQLTALLLSSAIALSFTAAFTAEQAHAAANATIVSGVNLRTQPSTSSKTIGILKAGETVELLAKANNYWYQVKDAQGRTGYVSSNSKYIKLLSPGSSSVGSSSNSGTNPGTSGSGNGSGSTTGGSH